MSTFRKELIDLINRHSKENGSCTPDYILADYLIHALNAFDKATEMRDKWYNQDNCNRISKELDKKIDQFIADAQSLPDVSEIVLVENSKNDEKVLVENSTLEETPDTTLSINPLSDDEIAAKIMLIHNYIDRRINHKFNDKDTRDWVKTKFYDVLGIFSLGNCIKTIICDETNNSPEIIDQNQLVVDIEYSIHGYNTYDSKKMHLIFGVTS